MGSSSYAFRSGFMRADFPITRIRFGSCEILPHTREILVDGQPRAVEPKVFDMVLYLIMQRDRLVLKDELLGVLWTGVFVSESVLARTVMKARKALCGRAPDHPVIKTIHGAGYRFVADVELCHDEGHPLPDAIDPMPLTMPAKANINNDRRRK